MQYFHKSVLLKEILGILIPKEDDELLVDGTLGEGGHTLAFLQAYPKLKVIGIDADLEIQEKAKMRLASFADRVSYYNGWSDSFFENYPIEYDRPNLILLDLGISMYHYVASKKGFSFSSDDGLDMRLSPSLKTTAGDIINSYSKEEIADILKKYGEERWAYNIASSVVKMRELKKIKTAKELCDIICEAVPSKYKHGRVSPATKTFQALRIAVNDELVRLPRLLRLSFASLKVGGRLGVITFHSLEDRIVKHYFRELGKTCVCPPSFPVCKCDGVSLAKVLTKKAICPTEEEVENNSAARSAKFRAIEKIRESA